VNTRLQVEHPVTEETTGVDLVIEQLRVADGLPLSFTETPPARGHSIEFRINAEDPGRGYLPTPGRITRFDAPGGPGVRLETGVAQGSVVPGSFDSLMAKLIVTGATREQALARARRALSEFTIEGVASVLAFHRAVLQAPAFTAEQGFAVHTRWIETEMAATFEPAERPGPPAPAALRRSWIELDGKRMRLGLPADLALAAAGASQGQAPSPPAPAASQPGDVLAPLTGSLVRWHRAEGDAVRAGEVIATLEAMKMETAVAAPCAGRLAPIARAGALLQAGELMAKIDPSA